MDRDEMFDTSNESDYLWCLHCERAYNKKDHRNVDGLELCAYEGCNGDTVLDARDWKKVREGREEEYPEIPVAGKIYPLYSD